MPGEIINRFLSRVQRLRAGMSGIKPLSPYEQSLRQAHRGTYPIREGYVHSQGIRGERHTRLLTNSGEQGKFLSK